MRYIPRQDELEVKYYSDNIQLHNKTVTKFLWWPLKIEGEYRWLESATIYYLLRCENDTLFRNKRYYWDPTNWVDIEKLKL